MRRQGLVLTIAAVAAATVCVAAPVALPAVHAEDITKIDIIGPVGSGQFGTQTLVLTNGNFVVTDPLFDGPAQIDVGAVFLYNGLTHQLISAITGSTAFDMVGGDGVTEVGASNFVIRSTPWDSSAIDVGAATWVNGTTGLNGVVSAANSLVGTTANDFVGGLVTTLGN